MACSSNSGQSADGTFGVEPAPAVDDAGIDPGRWRRQDDVRWRAVERRAQPIGLADGPELGGPAGDAGGLDREELIRWATADGRLPDHGCGRAAELSAWLAAATTDLLEQADSRDRDLLLALLYLAQRLRTEGVGLRQSALGHRLALAVMQRAEAAFMTAGDVATAVPTAREASHAVASEARCLVETAELVNTGQRAELRDAIRRTKKLPNRAALAAELRAEIGAVGIFAVQVADDLEPHWDDRAAVAAAIEHHGARASRQSRWLLLATVSRSFAPAAQLPAMRTQIAARAAALAGGTGDGGPRPHR